MITVEELMFKIFPYAKPKEEAEYTVLKSWAESIIDKCEAQVTTWDDVKYEDPGPLVEKLKDDVLHIKTQL